MITTERERAVAEAIGALDTVHRETVVLRFYSDLSYDEIAQASGVPLGTVKSRLFNGVQQCRRFLQQKGIIGDNSFD